jgi:phospholipid transport system substrate-binding protein
MAGLPNRRHILRVALFGLPVLALGPAWAADANDPVVLIRTLGDEAVKILAAPNSDVAHRRASFSILFREAFDAPTIGRFVLGRYWRTATPEEQKQYIEVFGRYVVAIYADRFSKYSGEQFIVSGSRQDGPDTATVISQIVPVNGNPPIHLEWKLARESSGYKVTDVVAENVSLSLTKRDEFATVLERNGGSVSGLIAMLKEKAN